MSTSAKFMISVNILLGLQSLIISGPGGLSILLVLVKCLKGDCASNV